MDFTHAINYFYQHVGGYLNAAGRLAASADFAFDGSELISGRNPYTDQRVSRLTALENGIFAVGGPTDALLEGAAVRLARWSAVRFFGREVRAESDQLFDATILRRTHNLSGRASSRNILDIANNMNDKGYDGPPIDVVKDDDGNMYVIDGHHRLAAAKMTNTLVKVNIVTDVANHPSSYQSIDEVINDSFFVGKDKLRLGR